MKPTQKHKWKFGIFPCVCHYVSKLEEVGGFANKAIEKCDQFKKECLGGDGVTPNRGKEERHRVVFMMSQNFCWDILDFEM